MLLRKKIDAVNNLGVCGERRNIGIYSLVIDSRLIAPVAGGSESLGVKNAGHFGAGKSHTLERTLRLYPENAYHQINGGSQKSLYTMGDSLKHKTLILTEGYALEARGKQDSEFACAMRNLLSEGCLHYQRPKKQGGNLIAETATVQGPISLITTTIQGNLEKQLDDRMLTIHPDASAGQTQRVMMQKAKAAAGKIAPIDENALHAWRQFHDSLEARDVIIPYAEDILSFFPDTGLPIAARRSFTRLLSAIKAITILYQSQRREDTGRLIADIADYAMAWQLVAEPVEKSLRPQGQCTDGRMAFITQSGVAPNKALAEKFGISNAALSQWLKLKMDNGKLVWCNAQGEAFADIEALTRAKHTGNAYIRCINAVHLPSPCELTHDPSWNRDGENYNRYDLRLDADGPVESPGTLGGYHPQAFEGQPDNPTIH
jgi:hypothetical protein